MAVHNFCCQSSCWGVQGDHSGKPQWCTDQPCSASSPDAARSVLWPSKVTCPFLLPLITSCDSGPSSLSSRIQFCLLYCRAYSFLQAMAIHKGVAALSSFFLFVWQPCCHSQTWSIKLPYKRLKQSLSHWGIAGYHYSKQHCRKQHIASLHITVIWEMLLLQGNGTVHMYFVKLCLCRTKEITFMTEILTFVRRKKKKKKSFVW